jgi:hypothetical protein
MTTTAAVQACHANGCDTEVGSAFMCEIHWRMVPSSLRDALTAPDREHSPTYATIAQAAIDAVAHTEARRTPRAVRPPRKPVQLTLFDVRPATR